MNTRFICWLLFFYILIGIAPLQAQEIMTPMREMYCKPGVEMKSPGKGVTIEYGLFPSYKINSVAERKSQLNANQHLLIKLKVPIINKPRMKALVGFRHFREAYDFGNIDIEDQWLFQNLENKTLKNSRLSAYLTRSFSHKHYVGFKGELAYTGDYKGLIDFSKRYRHAFLVGVFGMKPHANKEWGIGLVARFGYRGNAVFPFLIYNQTFSKKWGIEFTVPVKMMVRYNISQRSLFLAGLEFGSRQYSVDFIEKPADGPTGQYNIRRAEVQLNIAFDQHIASWFWFEVKTGYVRYLDSQFEGIKSQEEVDFNIKSADGIFFKFGIFVNPPKSFYK